MSLWGFSGVNKKGLAELTAKPLKLLVEPDGIEPTTSTMPL